MQGTAVQEVNEILATHTHSVFSESLLLKGQDHPLGSVSRERLHRVKGWLGKL